MNQGIVKVLMTGAGAPGAAGIIRCLSVDANIELHVADANPTAIGRFLCSKFVQIPKAKEPGFIEFIIDYCKVNKIQVIFPLVTFELFEFSYHYERFEKEGIKVIVSSYESLSIANNKSGLLKHLKSKGIKTPDFEVVSSGDFEGFIRAVERLGYPSKPIVVKPSISNGSRGVRILNASIDKFDLLFNYKPDNLYTECNDYIKIIKDREFPELLVSECLPGKEYTIDTIVDVHGKPILVLPRSRRKMVGGISVEGTFEENQEITQYCHDVICSMKLYGPIGIQVKQADDGTFKILEINPRIQGTSCSAMGLGINIPLVIVKMTVGELIEIPEIMWGRSFVRYWNEAYY